jgi:UDP-N-acetylglucosamine 1-carboxyvinyltransferase
VDSFRVVGGATLVGEVTVDGAKNSALKLMAASLLAVGRTELTNVPEIRDVEVMGELLRRLGCQVDHDLEGGRVVIDVPENVGHRADYDLVRAMRASISVLGPLVARVGLADVAIPGGDAIGSRGLDLHASGLERLGASVHVDHGYLVAEAPGGLRGAAVGLDFPSVGATENILMAAVLAHGTTVIDNAAREPEIVDIAQMLISMGAKIDGVGGSTLVVQRDDAQQPTRHSVVPDRIAAGTWAFAAATTRGAVTLRQAEAGHLDLVLDKLAHAGAEVVRLPDGFRVIATDRGLAAIDVSTLPYPGFPTDLQPFVLAYDAVAEGSGMVTENLFEARFRTVQSWPGSAPTCGSTGTTRWCTASRGCRPRPWRPVTSGPAPRLSSPGWSPTA